MQKNLAENDNEEKLLEDVGHCIPRQDNIVTLDLLSAPKIEQVDSSNITGEFIRNEVLKMISLILTVPIDEIGPTSDIVDDLGGDSLDLQELILTIESYFGIRIPDTQMEVMTTPQVIIAYIERKKHKIKLQSI